MDRGFLNHCFKYVDLRDFFNSFTPFPYGLEEPVHQSGRSDTSTAFDDGWGKFNIREGRPISPLMA